MKTVKLRIYREGQKLGELSLDDALALLEDGFLRLTDHFQVPDAGEEGTLSDLTAKLKNEKDSWLSWVQSKTASTKGMVSRTARRAVGQISDLTQRSTTKATHAANRLLEDYLPRVRQEVSQRLASSMTNAGANLRDEQFLRKVFGAVYDCLPKPVCRFVGEAAFVEFCLNHRTFLLKPQTNRFEDSGQSNI